MFSFRVLTCLRIVSIRIILNLNKFRQVGTCSDMFENRDNSYHIESEQVQTCFNMFRHVSTCSDMFENHMNCNNSYHIESVQV